MPLSQLSAPLTRQQACDLVDAVDEAEDLALAVSAHEDRNGEWIFEATCQGKPDIRAFGEIARKTLGEDVDFTTTEIDPDTDWIAKSLKDLPPVQAGGFFIYANHNTDQVPPDTIPIRIEAAQAFGTGHHETTMGCLQAISVVLRERPIKKCLDVGSGTGVLAIALAKRLKHPIIASDIDPVATRTTSENARLNEVEEWIVSIQASGLNHERISRSGPYDLIVANILAAPLTQLAPDMSANATNGTRLILSGILDTQAANIISTYARHNFSPDQRIQIKDWTTLILNRD